MAKSSKFTRILWLFLLICFIVAMVPLLSLRYIKSNSPYTTPSLFLTSSMQTSLGDLHVNNEENLSDLKKTQHVSRGKSNAMLHNHGNDMDMDMDVNNSNNNSTNTVHMDFYNKSDEEETLVPLSEIPKSPYYSFDPNIMPGSFLRNLQNSSKRIIKKWERSYFNHYTSADISDCDIITPECSLHKYLLKRTKDDDPNILPYRKCCVEHKALRDTTIWVVRKLKAANIAYFLSTGTALGALRHNGVIIPWDTDVDIAVYPNDGKKVEEIFRGNKEHFFRKDPHRKPMFWVYYSKNGFPAGGPHVEIFYDRVYTQFPHLLLPLQECLFYNESMMCPNVKQFEEWFPSGWKVYGGGHYNGPRSCTFRLNGKTIAKRRC
ncbi:LicD family [Trypanosoma melophagium]|uniref:LicD family n=1 Tax=Trypanosoma melophagium TaxID=715481 RepID=UPI00351A003A|nr:LicD family [Trypanosoma melophagium]